MDTKSVRLTQTVKKGGCAAKLPASDLRTALKALKIKKPVDLWIGTDTMDDACLWDLKNGQLMIKTLDFFTPIVDDAKDFGAIAAVNAISDIYAMGGRPSVALSILAFPSATLSLELLHPLLEGAIEKIEESGACLAGGHTIDDETLKLGFSVTGFVDRDRAWTNAGSKPGDVLVLTKGLGTGTITTALKIDEAPQDAVHAAIQSMKTLNAAPELLTGLTIHAATDITGFGLAGHSMQVAQASQVSFEIQTSNLPQIPGAYDCLKNEMLNKAHKSNGLYVESQVQYQNIVDEMRWLTLDPQTSGGLFLSIPEASADEVVRRLKARFPLTSVIGNVKPRSDHIVKFVN